MDSSNKGELPPKRNWQLEEFSPDPPTRRHRLTTTTEGGLFRAYIEQNGRLFELVIQTDMGSQIGTTEKFINMPTAIYVAENCLWGLEVNFKRGTIVPPGNDA